VKQKVFCYDGCAVSDVLYIPFTDAIINHKLHWTQFPCYFTDRPTPHGWTAPSGTRPTDYRGFTITLSCTIRIW